MRAVGSFLVVLDHFGIEEAPGGLGVLIFFVLSGFLITWLMLEEEDRYGRLSLRAFYARRFLRIFPAFYCYWFLLLALLLLLDKRIVWGQAIASAFYVGNYYQAILGDPNTGFSHTWSLAVEAQFYLLWPVAFLALRKNRARMAKLLVAVILGAWAYRGALHFLLGVSQAYVYEAFDTRADHLMMGCLLAVALRSGWNPAFWRIVCSSPLMGLPTVGLLALSALLEYLHGTPYRDTVGFMVNPLLSAILFAQLIAWRRSALWGWLNWPWVLYLGRISYSMYLYQQLVIEPPQEALAAYSPALQLAGSVTAVVVMGSISHFLVERPFLRLKNKFQRSEPPPHPGPGPRPKTARASRSDRFR